MKAFLLFLISLCFTFLSGGSPANDVSINVVGGNAWIYPASGVRMFVPDNWYAGEFPTAFQGESVVVFVPGDLLAKKDTSSVVVQARIASHKSDENSLGLESCELAIKEVEDELKSLLAGSRSFSYSIFQSGPLLTLDNIRGYHIFYNAKLHGPLNPELLEKKVLSDTYVFKAIYPCLQGRALLEITATFNSEEYCRKYVEALGLITKTLCINLVSV